LIDRCRKVNRVIFDAGGAERLVVDAALGLVSKGHQVHIYTSHCDPTHCFPEVLDPNSTLCYFDGMIRRKARERERNNMEDMMETNYE
jgi:hypothetical protein